MTEWRYVCDRCKKEVNSVIHWDNRNKSFELCPDCANDLAKFLENKQ